MAIINRRNMTLSFMQIALLMKKYVFIQIARHCDRSKFLDGADGFAASLFTTGLGALGLLGWRRKRKVAAAARLKHLIVFRRDRREAVSLFCTQRSRNEIWLMIGIGT